MNKKRKTESAEVPVGHKPYYRLPDRPNNLKPNSKKPEKVETAKQVEGEEFPKSIYDIYRLGSVEPSSVRYIVAAIDGAKATIVPKRDEYAAVDQYIQKVMAITPEILGIRFDEKTKLYHHEKFSRGRVTFLHPMEEIDVFQFRFDPRVHREADEICNILDALEDDQWRPRAHVVTAALVRASREQTVIGIIKSILVDKNSKDKIPRLINVWAFGLQFTRVFNQKNIRFSDNQTWALKRSNLVNVVCARLPSHALIGHNYYLEKGHDLSAQHETEEMLVREGGVAGLYVKPIWVESVQAINNPGKEADKKFALRRITEAWSAANFGAWCEKRAIFRKRRFDVIFVPQPEEDGKPPHSQATLNFKSMELEQIERSSKIRKSWKKDEEAAARKKAFNDTASLYSENAFITLHDGNGNYAFGVIIQKIASFDELEVRIDAQIYGVKLATTQETNPEEERNFLSEVRNGAEVELALAKDKTGFECLLATDWSDLVFKNGIEDTAQGRIIRSILGCNDIEPKGCPRANRNLSMPEITESLNDQQLETVAAAAHDEHHLIFQHSPAGAGKSYTLARAVLYFLLMGEQNSRILIITPTNMSLKNLVDHILKCCRDTLVVLDEMNSNPQLRGMSVLLILSKWGEIRTRSKPEDAHMRKTTLSLVKMLAERGVLDKLNGDIRKSVEQYIENRTSVSRRPAGEVEMVKLVASVGKPQVIFSTISMAEINVSSLLETKVLIVDEAAQIAATRMVSVASHLTNLMKMILTADQHQLQNFTADIPSEILRYGQLSIVEQLAKWRLRTATSIRLFITYRHQEHIAYCLEAIYRELGDRFEPDLSQDRTGLTSTRFPLPTEGAPIILLHLDAMDDQQEGTSRASSIQTEIATEISKQLDKYAPKMHQGLLSMYTLQAKKIQKAVTNTAADITTVDSYQGRECDALVLTTTRSVDTVTYEEVAEAVRFVSDDRRCLTALSRGRHAIFLIGNFEILLNGKNCYNFITAAARFTFLCDARIFMKALKMPRELLEYKNNILQVPGFKGMMLKHKINKHWQEKQKQQDQRPI
uniref:DNA2/NAM7 helicase-like C-terminal domain-containing protein n=1 Tax=Acrobeloides nanus TaxID=290746 RepID=A0A914E513_9BILA